VAAVIKPALVDFSDMSGGTNTVDPVTSVRKNQLTDSKNAILLETGFKRFKGLVGLGTTVLLCQTAARGAWIYERHDGSETVLLMDALGTLYSVDENDQATTSIKAIGGGGEVWFANWQDKCWMCDGNSAYKIEGTTASPIGIGAPGSAPTAAATSGGSLADGTYKIFVGYARAIAGINVLYGRGVEVGDVVLASGSNTISITNIPTSPDSQVTTKVVWMTDAAGSVYYYYGEVANATTSITISDDSDKNNALLYSVEAATNYRIDNPQFIAFHDKRLWVVVDNIVFYSYQEGNVYDLERFDSAVNYISYPFKVTGLISLGEHLYINTTQGIIKQPYGDPTARYELVSTGQTGKPFYFTEMRTVDYWNRSVIGMTNDGIRLFDGAQWSDVDLAGSIKNKIDEAFRASDPDCHPCGKVHRRENRTEYILSYRDRDVNLVMNNVMWALNLDSVKFYGGGKFHAAWERWERGAAYILTKKDNTIYYLQSGQNGSQFLKETNTTSYDRYFFDNTAAFKTALTAKQVSVTTRYDIQSLDAICAWIRAYVLGTFARAAKIKVVIGELSDVSSTQNIAPYLSAPPVFGVAVFDTAVFPQEGPKRRPLKLPRKMDGNMVYVIAYQDEDDAKFSISHLTIKGVFKRNRYT